MSFCVGLSKSGVNFHAAQWRMMKKRIANEKKDNEEAVSKRLKYQWKALNEKVERLEDRLNDSAYAKDTVFEKDSFVKADVFNTVLKRMIKSFDERFENVESTFTEMTDDILDMEKVAMKAAADTARLTIENCRNSEFHEFEEKLKAENVLVEKRIRITNRFQCELLFPAINVNDCVSSQTLSRNSLEASMIAALSLRGCAMAVETFLQRLNNSCQQQPTIA